MTTNNYDRLYIEFIYYFNVERDYFECHEVLEELWLQEGRSLLYQGLLQVAVGLYHHRNNNINGAVKLLTGAVNKLDPYPADSLGIDLGRLKQESLAYLEGLTAAINSGDPAQYPFYDLDIVIQDGELVRLVDELVQNPPVKHEEEDKH